MRNEYIMFNGIDAINPEALIVPGVLISVAGLAPPAFFSFTPFGITRLLVGLVFMLLAGHPQAAK